MKKNRIMKITSGSEAVEIGGRLLSPFFFITAITFLSHYAALLPRSIGEPLELLFSAPLP